MLLICSNWSYEQPYPFEKVPAFQADNVGLAFQLVTSFYVCPVILIRNKSGEQGWPSGESTGLPPMWPGFASRRRCHMWVKFVVGSLP